MTARQTNRMTPRRGSARSGALGPQHDTTQAHPPTFLEGPGGVVDPLAVAFFSPPVAKRTRLAWSWPSDPIRPVISTGRG